MIVVKTAREIRLMQDACTLSARALKLAGEMVEPGVSTLEIDTAVRKFIEGEGGVPSTLGDISREAKDLLKATEESLYEGIKAAQAGNRIGDIGSAVQRYVEARSYGVVRNFTGHGVGAKLHEEPGVPNFGTPGRGARLVPGMTIAIEPMITQGDYHTRILSDGWTAVTVDGSLAAHFEHTVCITPDGPLIMTQLS